MTKKVAVFIGSTNVPLSLVENVEFKEMLYEFDKRYELSGRKKIGTELNAIVVELQQKIFSILEKARKINVCIDIWTKKV